MPQSAIVIFGRADGTERQRLSASQRELQITPADRRTTQRVAAVTPGTRPRLATSWPWAMTTSGARPAIAPSAPAAPAGKSMCA